MSVLHYRNAGRAFGHHHFVHARQRRLWRDGRWIGVHHLGDGHIAADVVDGIEHRGSRGDPHELVADHHGEIILTGLINHCQRPRHRVGGRERHELAAHHFFNFQVAEQTSRPHHSPLAFRTDENEYADNHQPDRELQSDENKQDRQPLTHRCCDNRGAPIRKHKRQDRPQQASAVHRERRDEIEKEQRDVRLHNRIQQPARIVRHRHEENVRRQTRERQQHQGDSGVDHRTGQRDGNFVPRILGNTSQSGDATDWQEGDAFDLYAQLLGHHAVTEFVQRDAGEYGADKGQSPDRSLHACFHEACVANESEQQQKRHVQTQRDAENPSDCDRPTHGYSLPHAPKPCKSSEPEVKLAPTLLCP